MARQRPPPALPAIERRYLLSTPVPFFRDEGGQVWLDQLWALDLAAHLDYLPDLVVFAPEGRIEAPAGEMVAIRAPEGKRLTFVASGPDHRSLRAAVLSLPRNIRNAWRAIGDADLVHSGVAGWPLPPGLIVTPIALLRRRPVIIVIESAFWRLQEGQRATWKARLRARVTEGFARWSLRHATLAVYTTKAYSSSLPVGPKGTGVVLPACWIVEADLLTPEAAEAAWRGKPREPRFLMASRLVREKGVPLLLDALRRLESEGRQMSVDVIGEGDLKGEIEAFAASAEHVRLRLLPPVPYGADFMRLMRDYHALVVPTTGDEQPRVVLDGFSQAVPAVATDTGGNREVIEAGRTGRLVRPDSPEALADAMFALSREPDELRRMGIAALDASRGYTHAEMHRRRARILADLFPSGAARVP